MELVATRTLPATVPRSARLAAASCLDMERWYAAVETFTFEVTIVMSSAAGDCCRSAYRKPRSRIASA